MPKLKKTYIVPVVFEFSGTVEIKTENRNKAKEIAKKMNALIGRIQHQFEAEEVIDWNFPIHASDVRVGFVSTKY